jgi:hypothetical protein
MMIQFLSIRHNYCMLFVIGFTQLNVIVIAEGNTSYMLGAAHLLNIEKLQLFSRCLLQISKMQAQSYGLCAVPLVQLCLLAEFRKGQYLNSSIAMSWSKKMFDKSIEIESLAARSEITCSEGLNSAVGTGQQQSQVKSEVLATTESSPGLN